MGYSEIVNEHFFNPRNVGTLDSPDAIGIAGSPGEGEYVVLHFLLKEGKIAAARFQTFGCGPAIAACSLLTEWVKDKSIGEACSLTTEQLTEMLGGLPEDKRFCASLALRALHQALETKA